jgi:hypothetical protein
LVVVIGVKEDVATVLKRKNINPQVVNWKTGRSLMKMMVNSSQPIIHNPQQDKMPTVNVNTDTMIQ